MSNSAFRLVQGGGAPVDALFVVLSANNTLTNEFILTAGTNISISTAGGLVTLSATTSGGSGSGTVSPGSANNLAYYASAGTAVDDLIIGSANTILSVDSNGNAHVYKIISAGSNIGVAFTGTSIVISATTGGGGSGNVTASAMSDRAVIVGSGGGQGIASTLVFIDTTNGMYGLSALSVIGLTSLKRANYALEVHNTSNGISNQIAIFKGNSKNSIAQDESYISFYMNTTAGGGAVEYSRINTVVITPTAGFQYGELQIGTVNNGSPENQIGFGNRFIAPTSTYANVYDLGTLTRPFETLFVGSFGTINFNNSQVRLSHGGNYLTITGGDFTAPNFIVKNAGALQSDQVDGHTMNIQLWDTDAGSYVNVAAGINNVNPNFDLKEAYVTMNGNYIYHKVGSDVLVSDGGTGASTASSARTNLGFADGTYAPTRSAEVNLDSNVTFGTAQYMQVGSTVTVSGNFVADPTLTATSTSFEMTVPVASNFTGSSNLSGVAFCGAVAGQGAMIFASATNDTAKVQWVSADITAQTWSYLFTYLKQ